MITQFIPSRRLLPFRATSALRFFVVTNTRKEITKGMKYLEREFFVVVGRLQCLFFKMGTKRFEMS